MYNKSLENDNLYTQYNNIDGKLDLITLTVRGRQNTNAWRDVTWREKLLYWPFKKNHNI